MNENNVNAGDVNVDGEGEYENSETPTPETKTPKPEPAAEKDEEAIIGKDSIEYDPQKTPMEEIADEDEKSNIAELQNEDIPVETEKTKSSSIDESKTIKTPILKNSKKPGFNPNEKQDARIDNKIEGGVARPRTTGPMKSSGDAAEEGTQLKPTLPEPADLKKQFEMTGFTVSYEPKKGEGLISVQIRDYFPDIESAQVSINGDKYLMPLPDGGFKVVKISSGAPMISWDDRQLYEYINDKWRRK